MAIFDTKRYEVRHFAARLCNDLKLVTVASAAAGAFTDTHFRQADDYFNGWQFLDYSGTGAGKYGTITDFASGVFTFAPSDTLTNADLVELHRVFGYEEYNDAINMAIEMVAHEALVWHVDETVTLAASTYEYALPIKFLYITDIYEETSTADRFEAEPLDPKQYHINPNSTLELVFRQSWTDGDTSRTLWAPTAGRSLRIIGLASPEILTTDTALSPINPVFLAYQAAAILHQSRIRGATADSEYHSQQMKLCQAKADFERARIQTRIPAGAKAVVEAI